MTPTETPDCNCGAMASFAAPSGSADGREITAAVELPLVIFRQGSQTLVTFSEEQLCELMELIEESFTVFDAARQPKAKLSRPNAKGD